MNAQRDYFWWIVGCLGVLILIGCAVLAVFAGYFYLNRDTQVAERPALVVPTPPTTPGGVAPLPTLPPNLAPTVTLPSGIATLPGSTPRPTAVNLPVMSGSAAVIVNRAASRPVIDGRLDEWGSVPPVPLEFRVFARNTWDGTNDLAAIYRLQWDEANLYVGVTIEDDIHQQNESGRLSYRGDSLELQFDVDRPGDYTRSVSPDDYQLILSPGDFAGRPAEAYRFRGTTGGQMDDFPGHAIAVAAVSTGSGYTLEAQIPWRDLGVTPTGGLEIGAALNANDSDQGLATGQEIMLSNVSTRAFADPTTWGTLRLNN